MCYILGYVVPKCKIAVSSVLFLCSILILILLLLLTVVVVVIVVVVVVVVTVVLVTTVAVIIVFSIAIHQDFVCIKSKNYYQIGE